MRVQSSTKATAEGHQASALAFTLPSTCFLPYYWEHQTYACNCSQLRHVKKSMKHMQNSGGWILEFLAFVMFVTYLVPAALCGWSSLCLLCRYIFCEYDSVCFLLDTESGEQIYYRVLLNHLTNISLQDTTLPFTPRYPSMSMVI
jgi:hypothetical protein